MAHRQLIRLLSTASVAAAATAFVVAGVAPSPADAATACVAPDLYTHHIVYPAAATGGADVAGAKFGSAVVVADFNKDGFADVAVGAPADKVGSAASGTVTVFNGSAAGLSTTGKRLTQTNIGAGNEAGDKFGAALAAGDFNKDGYVDLAVGIPGEAVGTATGSGAVAVFPGSASGLNTGTFYGQTTGGASDEAGDAFGSALAAGDLNGDGYADLAIGAPGEAPGGGTVHSGSASVYKGSSTGVVRGWGVDQSDAQGTNEAGDKFGTSLAIGNVTGDSHADLVVGTPGEAPGDEPAGSGAIYVIPGASGGKGAGFGRSQGSDGGASETGDAFGTAVAVGNFDKDGFADIAVGIPGEAPATAPAGGSIAIFPGASSQVAAGYTLDESYTGEVIGAGDKFGASLATGDVDKDGYADLLIGAPGKSYGTATGAGDAYLFGGGPRQTGSTRSLNLGRRLGQTDVSEGNETGDAFGAGVALGDITGDGKAEAAVGASGEAGSGTPASGNVVALTNLAPREAAAVDLQKFTPTVAMQAPANGGSAGTIEYAYTNNVGWLLHGHQTDPNNVLSVQWTVISGTLALTGTPSLAGQADGKLAVVAHNADGTIAVNTETSNDPAVWGAWSDPAGPMASEPAIARQTDGTLVAFAVDASGVLWALPEKAANGGYASWVSLGVGGLSGTPVVVPVASGLQVFALTPSGAVTTVLYASNRTTSGCTTLAGSGFTGQPSVIAYPGNRLAIFARAADGSIQTVKQDATGAFPETWDTIGTFTAAGPPAALLSPSTGKTELVARGADGAIWSTGETIQGSGEWRDWVSVSTVGDVAATDPTVFQYSTGTDPTWAFVFRNDNNDTRIYEARSTGVGAQAARVAGPARTGFTAQTLPAPPTTATQG
ncbi:hypothetical protein GCM10023322_06450 [Rugosimonospora acidiphila]|uniref:PLL-like beta propeller domain-containing protein n=1 Tax=Rugosimonospora acidiphila TaxID=556531 RepID=A0ABP9RKH1_9ACTN